MDMTTDSDVRGTFLKMEEEFVDLVASPTGVISSVEDLVGHAIWNS